MIHSCVEPLVAKASEIAGMAKLRTVLSTATRSTGSIRTAREIQPLAPVRADGCDRGAFTPDRVAEGVAIEVIPEIYTVQPVQCNLSDPYH